MKTLRTVCLVCAGYYLLQTLGFLFSTLSFDLMKDMTPGNLDDIPMFRAQQDIATLMAAFAPYVLIGTLVCSLMAWRLEQWWKAIPVLSILLLAGGLIWLLAFIQQAQTFEQALVQGVGDVPVAMSGYLKVVTRLGIWGSAFPVLLPGVLILIFWIRAQRTSITKAPDSGRDTAGS